MWPQKNAEVDRLTDASGVDARVGASGGNGAVLREADFAAVPGKQRVIVATVIVDGAGVSDDEHRRGAVGGRPGRTAVYLKGRRI